MNWMAATIVIDESAWTAMTSHAEAGYPEEACGVLLGMNGPDGPRVHSAAACVNQAGAGSRTRFAINPEQLLEVSLAAREAGLEIVGFYHSHPDRGPYFSESDIQDCWPGCANVVLAVTKGQFRQARAYVSGAGRTRAGVRQMAVRLSSGCTLDSEVPLPEIGS